jgi:hypothetical protein
MRRESFSQHALASGCDVSVAQGTLSATHWKTLASAHRFVIIKCGDGNNSPDPSYRHNIHAARSAGLIVGTYHAVFVLPDDPAHPGRSPEEQALAHCGHAIYRPGDLLPWADVEFPDHTAWDKWKLPAGTQRAEFIADFIVRYVGYYAKISGVGMGFYSYSGWVEAAGLARSARKDVLASMPLWRADPLAASMPWTLPGGVDPWRRADLHQWTNSLRTPTGINMDGSVCAPSTLIQLTGPNELLASSLAAAADRARGGVRAP